MTAKKKIPEKVKEPEYILIFQDIEIIISEKTDLNYVSIGRKIRKLLAGNIQIKEKIKKPYLDKSNVVVLTRFNYKFYFDNLWFKYCKWFNSIFNKEMIENE